MASMLNRLKMEDIQYLRFLEQRTPENFPFFNPNKVGRKTRNYTLLLYHGQTSAFACGNIMLKPQEVMCDN